MRFNPKLSVAHQLLDLGVGLASGLAVYLPAELVPA